MLLLIYNEHRTKVLALMIVPVNYNQTVVDGRLHAFALKYGGAFADTEDQKPLEPYNDVCIPFTAYYQIFKLVE